MLWFDLFFLKIKLLLEDSFKYLKVAEHTKGTKLEGKQTTAWRLIADYDRTNNYTKHLSKTIEYDLFTFG